MSHEGGRDGGVIHHPKIPKDRYEFLPLEKLQEELTYFKQLGSVRLNAPIILRWRRQQVALIMYYIRKTLRKREENNGR